MRGCLGLDACGSVGEERDIVENEVGRVNR